MYKTVLIILKGVNENSIYNSQSRDSKAQTKFFYFKKYCNRHTNKRRRTA